MSPSPATDLAEVELPGGLHVLCVQAREAKLVYEQVETAVLTEVRAAVRDSLYRAEAVRAAGYNLDRVLTQDDLVQGDNCFFAATGLTDGQLLRGVRFDGRGARTQSLVMRSRSGTVRFIDARHRVRKLQEFSAIDYT